MNKKLARWLLLIGAFAVFLLTFKWSIVVGGQLGIGSGTLVYAPTEMLYGWGYWRPESGRSLAQRLRESIEWPVLRWSQPPYPRMFSAQLWPLLILFITAFLARGLVRNQRTSIDDCSQCGYDLTGLPRNRCPECGQPY